MRTSAHVLVLLLVLGLGSCGGSEPAAEVVPAVALPAGVPVPQILSLSVDPADGALFLSTDRGLLRVGRGAKRASLVDGRYEGVALRRDGAVEFVGPGRLLGSGHPEEATTGVPENLGLLISEDAGRSWRSVGLLGEADLHLLRPAGARLWAYDLVRQTLALTRDNGRTWTRPRAPGLVLDLAVDPGDDEHLIAVTDKGLLETRDAGRGWRPAGVTEAEHVLWARRDSLITTDASGTVRRSADGGATYDLAGRLADPAQAPLATAGGVLYAALPDGRVQRSADQGETWTTALRLVAEG